jgi:GntR family transcriptional regulator, transcriptional repressor for pyruvate dehydrogenase complex
VANQVRKIQKTLVHELVAQEIQTYIQEEEFKEGDKLPSVEEMTQMFGVGRSSLREALRYLQAVDIVRVENGKGIFVRDVDMFRFTGKVKIENEKKFLLSILDVRVALEGKAVELAAGRMTSAQMIEQERCLGEYRARKESGKDTSQVDLAFHRNIIKAADNPILESVLQSIWGLYEKFFNAPLGDQQIFDDTYPYHITMFEAIKKHDRQGALDEFHKMMKLVENKIRNFN